MNTPLLTNDTIAIIFMSFILIIPIIQIFKLFSVLKNINTPLEGNTDIIKRSTKLTFFWNNQCCKILWLFHSCNGLCTAYSYVFFARMSSFGLLVTYAKNSVFLVNNNCIIIVSSFSNIIQKCFKMYCFLK